MLINEATFFLKKSLGTQATEKIGVGGLIEGPLKLILGVEEKRESILFTFVWATNNGIKI